MVPIKFINSFKFYDYFSLHQNIRNIITNVVFFINYFNRHLILGFQTSIFKFEE